MYARPIAAVGTEDGSVVGVRTKVSWRIGACSSGVKSATCRPGLGDAVTVVQRLTTNLGVMYNHVEFAKTFCFHLFLRLG